jgi:PTS system fructose-specific IIC component
MTSTLPIINKDLVLLDVDAGGDKETLIARGDEQAGFSILDVLLVARMGRDDDGAFAGHRLEDRGSA